MIDTRTIRLFHITAISNLPAILQVGALVAKSFVNALGVAYENIAYQGAQGARAARTVPNPPGGVVHDYVPFYFAPRSPMLRAIEGGKVEGCRWRQRDIVHLETTVARAIEGGKPFVFYDRNATLRFSNAYTSLEDLTNVAWGLLTEAPRLDGYCKYWHNVPDNVRYADRMERRQAEFLVRERVELHRCTRIGVIDAAKRDEVLAICRAGVRVEIMRDWYF